MSARLSTGELSISGDKWWFHEPSVASVQDVAYASLQPRLLERKQLLKIEDVPPPRRK